jgi:DNA-binding beta-propeller fold protein YncE
MGGKLGWALAGASMVAAAVGCQGNLPPASTGITTSNPTAPILYAVTGCGVSPCDGNGVVAIDVTQKRAVAQAALYGANAIAYRGELLVAGGSGTTRISVLDPVTLGVTRTQTLPWDPSAAAFSADGAVLYAAHDDGYVSMVQVSDGSVTAEIQVPPAPGSTGPIQIVGLALDPTETFVGVTAFDGSSSSVAAIRITGQALAVAFNVASQPFPSSNCSRNAAGPAFDRAGTALATFDRNCGAFDVYDLASGALDPTASVLFARPYGSSLNASTIADAGGRFWADNAGSLYRTSLTDATQQASFSFGPTTGGLVTDEAGQTIYAFKGDPRTNGVFTIDPASGAATQLDWNLDLVPLGAEIVTATYVGP